MALSGTYRGYGKKMDNQSYPSKQVETWAKTFLSLGATAVIGTSWAVRSNTARLVAEEIYANLATGKTLGQAMEAARRRAREKLGDSSWLAYTVYGDPTAKAVAGLTGKQQPDVV